jgi:hypothetical protein
MNLKRRERILLSVTGGLVALAGLYFLVFLGDSQSDEELAKKRDDLQAEIAQKQTKIDKSRREKQRLKDWRERSLPPETSLARLRYQAWLDGLIKQTSLRKTSLTVSDATHRDEFTRISFELRARAALGDLVQFMYEFYAAGYLHQIRKINVKPVKNSKDLDAILTIEALSLPNAVATDQLPKVQPPKSTAALKFARLTEYKEPIVTRDFFAPYGLPGTVVVSGTGTPPPPPPPSKPKPDKAKFAFVTAFVEVDGEQQVWIDDRMDGKSLFLGPGASFFLGAGEKLKPGDVEGKVQAIRPESEVVVELVDADGPPPRQQRRLLHVGDNLRGGTMLEDMTPRKTAAPPQQGPHFSPSAMDVTPMTTAETPPQQGPQPPSASSPPKDAPRAKTNVALIKPSSDDESVASEDDEDDAG